MTRFRSRFVCALTALTLVPGLAAIASAQNRKPLITGTINNSQRATIAGNTRPEANSANDHGLAAASTPLNALQLLLHRSPENGAAFTQYIEELHNPKSASYHKWLTNAEIGALYGPAQEDIGKIEDWLASEGFAVHSVSPDDTVIEFSGTAGEVSKAFDAPLHHLSVNGKTHMANYNDPSIPAALTPVVSGVVKLNDFMPRGTHVERASEASLGTNGSGGGGNYIGAADLATIYNFNPLFKAGITGKGQTIVLIEDTDQYSVGDWTVFRKVLGLSRAYPYASLTQEHPTGTNTCGAPGIGEMGGTGLNAKDDSEAAIDVEWASAAAPNAAIVNAACADTETQFGGFFALANILQEANHPTIVSISYGDAETDDGSTENAYINSLYESAVAEGVSVFVSSGDEDAASYDNNGVATHGITVSGLTSTPYNISVGGTDWGYRPLHSSGTYFNSTNGPNLQTAVSYIPEIPWNYSCAGSLLAEYLGYPTYGSGSLCNAGDYLNSLGGSGGPSGCATGVPSSKGEVSGTCAGWPKPSWQSVQGNTADGVRDIPDVSLFAANGTWGSYYAVCFSDPTGGSGYKPCTTNPGTWAGYGGTSVSSPIWAGIQALVNQKTGQSWGNSNTVLYQLAKGEYGADGDAACNSSRGNAVGTGCVFYDVTQGDNVAVCEGSVDCYTPSGKYGILSTSTTAAQPAYSAGTGWDFSTGIGTVNAANLVNAWSESAP